MDVVKKKKELILSDRDKITKCLLENTEKQNMFGWL